MGTEEKGRAVYIQSSIDEEIKRRPANAFRLEPANCQWQTAHQIKWHQGALHAKAGSIAVSDHHGILQCWGCDTRSVLWLGHDRRSCENAGAQLDRNRAR